MKTPASASAIAMLTAACLAAPSLAADDEATRRDLFAVITLHGLPCGEVVGVATRGENDHLATCKDGNRYRVFLNAEGRVVVERQ
ncbi:hypothetical protein BURK1_01103 [Burkholderiales bacterium]|nr:hypothetical protein BURK1_01103 [Burkholderiales bacterium]